MKTIEEIISDIDKMITSIDDIHLEESTLEDDIS